MNAGQMNAHVNVADAERWASAIGGAALAAWGLKQLKERSPVGWMIAAAGGALIYRGATGHCPVYSAAGVNTAADDSRVALGGRRGVQVEQVVTIDRSPEALYAFWRQLEQLPRFMRHLASVQQLEGRRSHWVARAAGRTVEGDAEIINEIPNGDGSWTRRRRATRSAMSH